MFSEKLKALRKSKNMSQAKLSKELGVTQQAVGRWEKDLNMPDLETLVKIANYFHVTVDYLADRHGLLPGLQKDNAPEIEGIASQILDNQEKIRRGIRIPVLGTIVAGVPVDANEEILGWEEITESMAAQGEFFALRVRGRSMEPRLVEGDTVIIKKEPDVESGRVAVVLVGREEATLKQVKKAPDGITLIGYNALVYEPHFYSNTEIEEMPIQILGEVVELRRKF